MNTPKPVKVPCPSGTHRAKLSTVTGLIKSHSHKGKHCNGSGQPPAPSKKRRFW